MIMNDIRVMALYYYPLKSCRGTKIDLAPIDKRGIKYDRAFMVTDAGGNFQTQRKHPKMSLIRPVLNEKNLTLSAPDMPELTIAHRANGPALEVSVWQDRCLAVDQGEQVSQWLSKFLGFECRLVRMRDNSERLVNQHYRYQDKDQIAFADGFPFLLIAEESLTDLNKRLAIPLPMDRFRPNIVVKGSLPYAEDSWRQIRIGSLPFTVAKPCERCIITTINQATGTRHKEPLMTLNTYRKNKNGKVEFGQNLIHHQQGEIRVGDRIEVVY
jgi:uncharacterized protein YcbX